MKVLITGAGGFIAGSVGDWLGYHTEHEIIGSYHRKKPWSSGIQSIRCDLFQEPEVLEDVPFDAVIHFASQLYGNGIRVFLDNTVQATRNIIDVAQKKGIKKFIYISSISVCGETSGAIKETSDRINLNDYELTKWIGERLLEEAQFPCKVIIRLPRVLGKGIDPMAPWLPKISYELLNNKEVTYYHPQNLYNALIHTEDLAKFLKQLLEKDGEMKETFVLGSKAEMTVIEILELLKKKLQSTSKLVEVQQKGKSRCHMVDISKALKTGFLADTVENVLIKYVADMKGES